MVRRFGAGIAVLLAAPLWVALAGGALSVRACVPAGSALMGTQFHLFRAAPSCPSGAALSDGAVVLVGTVCLTGLLAAACSLAALAGVRGAMRRLGSALREIFGAALAWRRSPGATAVPAVRSAPSPVASHGFRSLARINLGSLARRGPPAFA